MNRLTFFVLALSLISSVGYALPGSDGMTCGRVVVVNPTDIVMTADNKTYLTVSLSALDATALQSERQLAVTEMLNTNFIIYCAGWNRGASPTQVNFVYSQIKTRGF